MNSQEHKYFPFGFPVSQAARKAYGIDELAGETGSGIQTEIQAMRQLAARMESERKKEAPHRPPVRSGHLLAMGLLEAILRYVIDKYCFEEFRGSMNRGVAYVREHRKDIAADRVLEAFAEHYPPQSVSLGDQSKEEFLESVERDRSSREEVVREAILVYLSMANRALVPHRPLFDDTRFRNAAPYVPAVECLNSFFNKEPALPPLDRTLFELLYAPMNASPDSLDGQLEYILENWRSILPESLLRRLLLTRSILQEEMRGRGAVEGSIEILRFGIHGDYPEVERYSQDRDWMPNAILIAKSTHVWLDQLSKRYAREVRTLDQIPDEELERLARWGFTGLWLIGLWERSPASRRIKEIMGNPEAHASAYSLYDYTIAQDLGGEAAYENLRERAWQRGIRLASDMVPNHVGIYSKWLIEHPDWFIQLDNPPYPTYRFSGENLSHNSRVVIQLEDGYWNRSDAAVVFKRHDSWTGDTKYIYHGNDGTHMPWNDTAQLNYLNPEVREAVIQAILHVARKFSIIRFDAAMTLAKKHYQRLWFPQPGQGGAIPSRSEHGMTRDEFDAAMPEEFWREVVDRIASEVPDTLLIAEAFWLMEGYFVRTLGMHRVYNSAFMNMLKMEENANYRSTVRNVLEYSPGILQRFVNFMNNPDERTAVEQFGKDDKYFGVAMMMVTMPGLPMFGHGQVEGFTERYGMEYRRAYWDEAVDEHLVRRHEAEIFPLMRKRYLFSGVANFALFNFETLDGHVDEDVFVYSNRVEDDRALVIYNNKFKDTSGWIRRSTAINHGTPKEPNYIHKSLADALRLNHGHGYYYTFQDHRSGLEYIRAGNDFANNGLYAELHAYQYQVFLNFREFKDEDGTWGELNARLAGRGVENVDREYKELVLEPLLTPFRTIMNEKTIRPLIDPDTPEDKRANIIKEVKQSLAEMLEAAQGMNLPDLDADSTYQSVQTHLDAVREFHRLARDENSDLTKHHPDVLKTADIDAATEIFLPDLAAWSLLQNLKPLFSVKSDRNGKNWMDEWLLAPTVQRLIEHFGVDGETAYLRTLEIKVLTSHPDLLQQKGKKEVGKYLRAILQDQTAQECLGVNEYNGAIWLSKERLESFISESKAVSMIRLMRDPESKPVDQEVTEKIRRADVILDAAKESGYEVEKMLDQLS